MNQEETKQQARDRAEIMLAFADGKEVECRGQQTGWRIAEIPSWNWQALEYRIKPRVPRACRVMFYHNRQQGGGDPWGYALEFNSNATINYPSELVPMIEITPEARAALEAAKIEIPTK